MEEKQGRNWKEEGTEAEAVEEGCSLTAHLGFLKPIAYIAQACLLQGGAPAVGGALPHQ